MTGWILYKKEDACKNRGYIDLFTAKAKEYDINLACIYLEDLVFDHLSTARELPDFVINRSRSADAAAFFETKNCRVFNPSVVSRICNHKMLTYQFMQKHQIPIMETVYTQEDAASLGFPIVVKPACGHGGDMVSLVKDVKELKNIICQIHEKYGSDSDIVYQKCASDTARDLRVYILNKKVLACMLRQGVNHSDIRSNYSLGGQATFVTLNDEEEAYVMQIVNLLPFDCVGIDFIYHNGHPVFNEIEDAVGARMLYANTDIDLVSDYMKYIYFTL